MSEESQIVCIKKGYKFRAYPNMQQEEFFMKNFGCSRKIYNEYVSIFYDYLESVGFNGGKIELKDMNIPSPSKLKQKYNFLKEVDSLGLCNAKINFERCIKTWNKDHSFKDLEYSKKAMKKLKDENIQPTIRDIKYLPSFKSKKSNDFAYKTNNQNNIFLVRDENNSSIGYINLPKLQGKLKIKLHRRLPDNYVIKNCTIKKLPNGFYELSIGVEYFKTITTRVVDKTKTIGLDYSQQDFFVSSEGTKANYPHYYRKSENRLSKEQRKLSKMQRGSSNYYRQKMKVAKLSYHIAQQRKDFTHKLSRHIADKYDAVFVEDLDLRNLAQCLSLGKNLNDNGFGMFRIFLKYKLEERGKKFVKIDKWQPSSSVCSYCGAYHKDIVNSLKVRDWTCPDCGTHHDRDINAAINIQTIGLQMI